MSDGPLRISQGSQYEDVGTLTFRRLAELDASLPPLYACDEESGPQFFGRMQGDSLVRLCVPDIPQEALPRLETYLISPGESQYGMSGFGDQIPLFIQTELSLLEAITAYEKATGVRETEVVASSNTEKLTVDYSLSAVERLVAANPNSWALHVLCEDIGKIGEGIDVDCVALAYEDLELPRFKEGPVKAVFVDENGTGFEYNAHDVKGRPHVEIFLANLDEERITSLVHSFCPSILDRSIRGMIDSAQMYLEGDYQQLSGPQELSQ